VIVNRSAYSHNEPARNESIRNEPIRSVSPQGHVENNVYAGHNGDIYRRTNDGWQQHTTQGWTASKTIPEARPEEHFQPSHVEQAPARVEREPSRVERQPEAPARASAPREYEQARQSGGLEADHAAREHGAERSRGR